ncbi:MAG: hypothetical protein ACPGXK_00565 [Phycisphaerae bacterium]
MNRTTIIRSAKALFVCVAMFGMVTGTVGCASDNECCGKCQQSADCGPNCGKDCCKKASSKCSTDCAKSCCKKS